MGVLLGVSSVAFAFRRREQRLRFASELPRQEEPVSDRAVSPPEFERLVADLAAVVAGGDTVLVAGPGVAVALGEPTPRRCVEHCCKAPHRLETSVARR